MIFATKMITKPLGFGVIIKALKRELAQDSNVYQPFIAAEGSARPGESPRQ
jgi:hypothetical protein